MARRQEAATAVDTESATYTDLLDVAERCFERYGIRRTTMEDIATEARVSRPTLYRYFGDRDSLITALSQRRAASFAGRMRTVFAGYDGFEEQLVEGMLHLAKVGARDQFFSSLITPETVGHANRMLMAPEAAIDFAAQVWGPVLDAAQERGELRAGIDRRLAYAWLTSVNILAIGWVEISGRVTDSHRRMVRSFVAPAFLRD